MEGMRGTVNEGEKNEKIREPRREEVRKRNGRERRNWD